MNRQKTIGWWPSLTSSLTSLIAAWSFVSACAGEVLRSLGEGEQPPALSGGAGVVVLVEGAGRGVEALGPFVAGVVHDGESAELVGLLDGLGGEVVGAVRSVAAAAAGLEPSERSSASADHQRTRWRRRSCSSSRTMSRAHSSASSSTARMSLLSS